MLKQIIVLIGLLSLSLLAGCAPTGYSSPGYNLPTTINKFGSGYIMNTPGQMPTTINKFGSGYIINTPGQRPTTVTKFGSGYIFN